MVRREGNGIQAKITIPEALRGDKDDRVGPNRQLTFEIISEWIKLQGFDEYTERGLINLAASYPTSALKSFRRNFNLMLARVREERRREQNQQENRDAKEISERKDASSESEIQEVSSETKSVDSQTISDSDQGFDSREQDSLGAIPAE